MHIDILEGSPYVTRYMKMYHKSGFELLCHAKPAKWAEHLAVNPIKIW